ncbi:MAG TPA: CAP domain-containing protein [Candidatus Dormibacteraeota bacterium]|nr:CAP domain-containing protein [Candidatus Dormibacteraeota bacterium]
MTMLPARALAFDSAAAEAQLTGAINADRAGNGQGPLMVNATLASIARSAPHSVCGGQSFHGRSQDMIERVYFSHQIPPCGSYVWPVMSAYGVQFSASGENIGWNNYDPTTSVAQVNTAFMNSPGHRANILGAYNQVGVGAFMAPGTWNGISGVIMYTEIFSMGPAPAPVYPPFTGRAQVGVVGTDGHLWATQGGGFSSLGGNLLAAPAVATVPAVPGGVLYVGTGTDHDLWVRSPGMGWQRLNGGAAVYCIDNPAVAVIGSTLHVACQGRDRALWYASGTISGGSLPSVGGWRSLGGVLASGPAAGQLPGAATPVFLVEGTDHAIWTRDVAGSGWGTTGWVCFGHPAFAGTPIGTAYFACHGADGQVWAAANDGSGWSGAWAIGGSVVDGVAVSLTPTGANFLYQGLDGHVYEISRTNGSQSGISVLGGSVKYGVGAAP